MSPDLLIVLNFGLLQFAAHLCQPPVTEVTLITADLRLRLRLGGHVADLRTRDAGGGGVARVQREDGVGGGGVVPAEDVGDLVLTVPLDHDRGGETSPDVKLRQGVTRTWAECHERGP